MVEQSKFTYSPFVKALQKHSIEDQGRKQGEPLKFYKPEAQPLSIKGEIPGEQLNEEVKKKKNK